MTQELIDKRAQSVVNYAQRLNQDNWISNEEIKKIKTNYKKLGQKIDQINYHTSNLPRNEHKKNRKPFINAVYNHTSNVQQILYRAKNRMNSKYTDQMNRAANKIGQRKAELEDSLTMSNDSGYDNHIQNIRTQLDKYQDQAKTINSVVDRELNNLMWQQYKKLKAMIDGVENDVSKYEKSFRHRFKRRLNKYHMKLLNVLYTNSQNKDYNKNYETGLMFNNAFKTNLYIRRTARDGVSVFSTLSHLKRADIYRKQAGKRIEEIKNVAISPSIQNEIVNDIQLEYEIFLNNILYYFKQAPNFTRLERVVKHSKKMRQKLNDQIDDLRIIDNTDDPAKTSIDRMEAKNKQIRKALKSLERTILHKVNG